jgi:hypothetical protein
MFCGLVKATQFFQDGTLCHIPGRGRMLCPHMAEGGREKIGQTALVRPFDNSTSSIHKREAVMA